MRYTRTHTVFFSEDQLDGLNAEYHKLADDLKDRKSAIDAEMYDRAEQRLNLLSIAIHMLGEEAD